MINNINISNSKKRKIKELLDFIDLIQEDSQITGLLGDNNILYLKPLVKKVNEQINDKIFNFIIDYLYFEGKNGNNIKSLITEICLSVKNNESRLIDEFNNGIIIDGSVNDLLNNFYFIVEKHGNKKIFVDFIQILENLYS